MKHRQSKGDREPTIALINIVFLMLIFFLVAGTLATPIDRDLELVRTAELDPDASADALVIHPDGRLTWNGSSLTSAAELLATLPEDARRLVRVIPDRALPAKHLIAAGRDLRMTGAERVVIVTERGAP